MARRRLVFAWVAVALALASCVSPEELRREDEATCTGFGFHPGTDAFASCLQKESLARRYWAAPPAPYWGWGLLGRGLGIVLALDRRFRARGRSHLNILGGYPSTAASAIRGSAPWRISALDHFPLRPLGR